MNANNRKRANHDYDHTYTYDTIGTYIVQHMCMNMYTMNSSNSIV